MRVPSGVVQSPVLVLAAIFVAVGAAFAPSAPSHAQVSSFIGPDAIPRVDLDEARHRVPETPEPLRARWLLRPSDSGAATARLGLGGVTRVAVLDRFDGTWVLEAPIDSADAVTALFGELGDLQRDQSGRPALLESTALIGVRDYVWRDLDLEGDPTNAVAILDSGCDTAHDDLGDPDSDDEDTPPAGGDIEDWVDAETSGYPTDARVRVVGWHDVSDDLPLAVGPYDYHNHGTAMAGAGFGSGRLEETHRGVAPEGRMVIVKTWNFEGRWELWASDLLLGIDWVLDHRDTHRIRAVLIAATWDAELGIEAAVQSLIDAGIVVVAAAGNDGGGPMGWPARVDDVVAVGATNSRGLVASYSTVSPPESSVLDLLAPGGSRIDPSDTVVLADNEPNDAYRGRVGTSIAAAHVAGTVSLMSEALTERGVGWTRDRRQVRWIHDLLRVTAVETAGAELGAPGTPRLDRRGPDSVEGYGLLQACSAVDAVRNILWPGDQVSFSLTAPTDGRATYAARIPVVSSRPLRVDLVPPAGADFDVLLYHEREDGLSLVGSGTTGVIGGSERIQLDYPRSGAYVLVVKRVLGSGEAVLLTDQEFSGDTRWPLSLSSEQRSAPVFFDLDADGKDEILVVNNLAIDPTAHRFHAFNADGTNFGFFPRTYFSSPGLDGELRSPAVGQVGDRTLIVSGTEFGQVFAVRTNAQLAWAKTLTAALPTTAAAVWNEGPSARILVGTFDGIAVLDSLGGVEATLDVTAGVSIDLALGDIDSDGVEEIAAIDRLGDLHLLEVDGSEKPGWPVSLGISSAASAPVFVGDGDGAGPRRVAVAWLGNDGQPRMHAFGLDANPVIGFPVTLAVVPGGNVQTLSPAAPSVLRRGGEVHLIASSLQRDATGAVLLRLHRVARDGTPLPPIDRELAPRGMPASFIGTSLNLLGTPVVGDFTSVGDLEVMQYARAGWSESNGSILLRYGSVSQIYTYTNSAVDPTFRLPLDGGHVPFLFPGGVGPAIGDVDRDGRSDLVVTRGREVYVTSSVLPAHVEQAWGTERGDAARRACYGCGEAIVVDTPVAARTTLELDAAPNPFNPRTELRLRTPGSGRVQWTVYDARGRRVRQWQRWVDSAGVWRETFEGRDTDGAALASGVYLVRASWGEQTVTTRIALVR